MQNPITNGGSNHTVKGSKTSTSAAAAAGPKTVKDHPLVVKIRQQCMKRGSSGVKGLGRFFKRNDDDGNNKIDQEELFEVCSQYGMDLSKAEVAELLSVMDEDGSGTLDFNEFLFAIQPALTPFRMKTVDKAFIKMDKTGDGTITIDDFRGVYSVKKHPKFVNGDWTEDKCLAEYLKTFDVGDDDGKVTREEWDLYFSKLSMNVDDDSCWDLMMRNAWGL